MKRYSVKQLADMAGVSVRTLHHYDRLGLLKPSVRTEARYRQYGEQDLIRLQQILFYRELDFALATIRQLLAEPDFDAVTALQTHRQHLYDRRHRLTRLLSTIDKTIAKLKGESISMTDNELYEGFSGQQAKAYRQQAVADYGQEVELSEQHLRQLGKEGFEQLKAEQQAIGQTLLGMMQQDPTDAAVQQQIARHYANIRGFWGEAVCRTKNMAEAYKGLADLYLNDLRFTSQKGQANPAFAAFLSKAMIHFANTQLPA